MTGSNGSELLERKRVFLETFRRWEVLFKRSDKGDVQAAKWLIAEYFDSLGHLSPKGLNELTRQLKERCIFFPTIHECLKVINAHRYDWGNPFAGGYAGGNPAMFAAPASRQALAAPARQLAYDGGSDD